MGGVVGAVLAALGVPLLQGPPPLAPEAGERLASVERMAGEQSTTVAALVEQMTGVEEQLGGLDAAVGRLAALEATLGETVASSVAEAVAEVPSRDGAAIAAHAARLETLQEQVSALAGRLVAERERLDMLREETASELRAAIGAEAARLEAAVVAALAAGESRAEALEAEFALARQSLERSEAELAALDGRIDELQTARNRAAVASLLVREIDLSLASGAPFADPLERLAAMAGGDPGLEAAIQALGPAAGGVATIDELRARLADLEQTSEAATRARQGFVGRTVDNIAGLVEVRPRDAEADAAHGMLEAADAALRQGALEAAIRQVEEALAVRGLGDLPAGRDWLDAARLRLAAIRAQASLDGRVRDFLTTTVN